MRGIWGVGKEAVERQVRQQRNAVRQLDWPVWLKRSSAGRLLPKRLLGPSRSLDFRFAIWVETTLEATRAGNDRDGMSSRRLSFNPSIDCRWCFLLGKDPDIERCIRGPVPGCADDERASPAV